MTQEIKLCKDCVYYKPCYIPFWPFVDDEFSKCTFSSERSLVSGKYIIPNRFCDLERRTDIRCGPEAKNFLLKSGHQAI